MATVRARGARVRLSAVAVLLTVLGALLVPASPAAAVTPGSAVSAGPASHRFGWHTPAVPAASVRVANSSAPGSASTVLTLLDASAPTSYRFALDLPPGVSLTSDGAGGFDVVAAAGEVGVPVAHLDAPWARDASGVALPTGFTLSGNVLTQWVNTTGAVFPVTADPHYTWGWVSGTAYLNRGETHNVASGGTAVAAAVCAGLNAVAGPYAGAGCLAVVGDIVFQANRAWNSGKCVKLKMYGLPPVASFGGAYVYSGGYCR